MIDVIDWFCLINSPGITTKTFWSLLQIYGTASKALKYVKNSFSRATAEKIINDLDCSIITAHDDSFPEDLKKLSTCPPLLFAKGNINLLRSEKVAIIGARNASITGRSIAFDMSSDLSKDFVIVSGLAHGIDTSAHVGALKSGNTIAVLPFSFQHIFPQENKDLLSKIVENGLAITEIAPCINPEQNMFYRRNRIISAISSIVIIIEAGMPSGTLSTALLNTKKVMVIPGSPADPRYKGSNHLLKNGAILVENASDVRKYLTKHNPSSIKTSIAENIIKIVCEKQKISIDMLAHTLHIDMQTLLCNLSELEILGKIKKSALNDIMLNV